MRTYLVFVLVLFPSALLGQTDVRFDKFINQHVNQGMSHTRCTSVMRNRKITETNSNVCKETNTFIDAGTNEIKKVCDEAGTPYGNNNRWRQSTKPFSLVICTLKKGKNYYPHCQYRGRNPTNYIVIECEDGFPVHFVRDIVSIG